MLRSIAMEVRATTLLHHIFASKGVSSQGSASSQVAPKVQISASTSQSVSTNRSGCPVCTEHHLLENCRKFYAMSPSDRSKVVWDNRRCFKCLTPDHLATHCTVTKVCAQCNKHHHTLLHGATRPVGPSNKGPRNQNS